MKIKLLFLSLSVAAAIQCTQSLKELAAQEYCKDLPHLLQDLKKDKLNLDIQNIIKKQLINQYPHLFPIPVSYESKVKTLEGQYVVFSYDNRRILTLTNSHIGGDILCILDLTTDEKTVKRLIGHTMKVTSIALSPDGTQVLTGSDDTTARLWDVDTGKTLQIFSGHTHEVASVAISKCGKHALTGSKDKTARLWDLTTGKTIATLSHADYVNSVAFSPDDRYALTGCDDKTARLWDLHNVATEPLMLQGHSYEVRSVAFNSDGTRVLTGSWDHTARLWNVATGETIKTLKGHTKGVSSLAISPDGKYALTGSSDDTARLWNLSTGQTIKLEEHINYVTSVAFSPDGNYALIGLLNRTVRLWDLHYWMSYKENGEPVITLEQVIEKIHNPNSIKPYMLTS